MKQELFDEVVRINFELEQLDEALSIVQNPLHKLYFCREVVREQRGVMMAIEYPCMENIRHILDRHSEQMQNEIMEEINNLKKEIEEL